jgi:perosamine synthetase
MSFVAPAGTPISSLTFVRALTRSLTDPAIDSKLGQALAIHAGRKHHWLTSTGRGGMVLTLQAMRDALQDPHRTEVIVPAYTCYSVPAAVVKAGLKPRLCDIDPITLSPDLAALERFDFSRVLAIVTANLYGIPNQLDGIEAIARRNGVWLLDDAAQALGAKHAGRPVGGFGEAGLFSFDKGKNITSLEGGAVVASDAELAAAIQARYAKLAASSASQTTLRVIKLAAYSALLRPTLYGVVRKLPGLGLGRTPYDETYPVERYSRVLAGFADTLLQRLQELSEQRRKNATALITELRDIDGVQLIEPPAGSQPVYARLPILIEMSARRAAVIEQLENDGIGATASYPSALCDVPEVAALLPKVDMEMPGARRVASSIVTLPTHAYSPSNLPTRVAASMRAVLTR